MLPVTVHVPVAGLYSSALASGVAEAPSRPPATSTWPFGSSVAVWSVRAVFKLPVFAQVPEVPAKAGRVVLAIHPTASNATNPSLRTVANLCTFLQIMTTSGRRLKGNQNTCRHGGSGGVTDGPTNVHGIVPELPIRDTS